MKNFLISSAITLSTSTGFNTIDTGSISLAGSTPELIGSVVAGIVSTVLINILKSKYPKLFKKAPKNKYE